MNSCNMITYWLLIIIMALLWLLSWLLGSSPIVVPLITIHNPKSCTSTSFWAEHVEAMEICSPCSVGSHFPAASPARDHHVLGWGSPGTGVSWKSAPDGAAGWALPLWKMMEWKSVGIMKFPNIPYIWNIICSKPPTRWKSSHFLMAQCHDSLRIHWESYWEPPSEVFSLDAIHPGWRWEKSRTFHWTEAWFVGTDIGANVFRIFQILWW